MIALIAFGGLYATFATFNQQTFAAGTVRYVAVTGSDGVNNLCTTPTAPCSSLQYAVDVAADGDEIRIATGVYSALFVRQGVTQTAYITKALTLVGGYAADFSFPPDPTIYTTTFDAAGLGRGVVVDGVDALQMSGVRIINGRAEEANNRGGGLFAVDSQVTVRDCEFVQNQAEFGGGVYIRGGMATIEASSFDNNEASYGGGIYLQRTPATVRGNQFVHNSAVIGGGGMRLYSSNSQIRQNEIMSNTAGLHGGGVYITLGELVVADNMLAHNQLLTMDQGWGGGLHAAGSGSHISLLRNEVVSNMAAYGGGMRLFDVTATLDSNVLRENIALFGGGLALQGGTEGTLNNTAVIDNQSMTQGAGVFIQDATAQFKQTTLARNGGSGEAVVIDGAPAVVTMQNSIFADHAVGVVKLNNNSQVLLESTLWDNNGSETAGSVANIVTFSGNAALGVDGYHLLAGSAAIDVGMDTGVTADIDGHVRPYYGGYDLGADEWSSLLADKTVSAYFVQPGDTMTYTIVLTNPLMMPLTATLTDTLPSQVVFAAPPIVSSGNWTVTEQILTWNGSLPAESSVKIAWAVQIDAALNQGEPIVNTALVRDNIGTFETSPAVSVWPVRVYLPSVMQ